MALEENILALNSANSIIRPFLRSVELHPHNHALWVNKKYYSYQELLKAVDPLVAWLKRYEEARCLIFSPRTLTAYFGIIATLLVNKAYVPLNPAMPTSKNAMMLELADSQLIIADITVESELEKLLVNYPEYRFSVLFVNGTRLPLWTTKLSQHKFYLADKLPAVTTPYCPAANRQEDACLLFTSGSTGKPKGVMLSHENILSYLAHTIKRYQLSSQDRVSQITELTFDFSVQDMFMSWGVGACVYAFPENYFIGLPNYLNTNQISIMTTVPSTARLLHQLGKLTKNAFPHLRRNIFGGEPFSDSLARLWQEAAPNSAIDNVCGPTEATIAYLAYPWKKEYLVNKKPRDCIPLGHPFPGQEILIVDACDHPVEQGVIGELYLAGSQVITGYWCNPVLSQERFIMLPNAQGQLRRWYKTGDMVLWDEQEGLIFKGRADDQIQIRGCRVEKLEIERVVRDVARTECAAVVPWPVADDGTVQGVIAFVSDTPLTARAIINDCRNKLPDYMLPKEIHILERLPLNGNGKIDYLVLKKIRTEQLA
jgi:D-alanine--poly(phosphoribitol) ligase subunit 1